MFLFFLFISIGIKKNQKTKFKNRNLFHCKLVLIQQALAFPNQLDDSDEYINHIID